MKFIGLDQLRVLAGKYKSSSYSDYLKRLIQEAEGD
jgi:hypothetical protein